MSDERIGITGIGQIAFRVRDLRGAISFYRDVLGLPLLFEAPPGMAFFDCGGTRLMLSLPEEGDGGPPSLVYYTVEDIQGAARQLEARGAALEQAPHLVAKLAHADLWLAFLRDSEGGILALMSEVPQGRPS